MTGTESPTSTRTSASRRADAARPVADPSIPPIPHHRAGWVSAFSNLVSRRAALDAARPSRQSPGRRIRARSPDAERGRADAAGSRP